MNKEQLISIIIPAYNCSKSISRSIDSVIKQTYSNWELLIIDDGSTDKTKEIVEEYITKNPKLKYYHQENSGAPASPRNNGIRRSKGNYIAFLDHDDEWLPEKLAKQVLLFENLDIQNIGFVACNVYTIEENNKKIIKLKNRGNILEALLEGDFIYSCSSVMIKKDVFQKVGLFDENLKCADDWDMWLKISSAGYNFNFVDEPILNYYIHNNNTSKTIGNLKIHLEQEYILKKYPQFYSNKKINYTLGIGFLQADSINRAKKYLLKSLTIKPFFNLFEVKIIGVFTMLIFGNLGLHLNKYLINKYLSFKKNL